MHTLSNIAISNFRSCKSVELPLGNFTPLVGYNNAGKSNILSAIEWLIEPTALTADDFFDARSGVVIEGKVTGINNDIVSKLPPNQQSQIGRYIVGEMLRFRRILSSPGAVANIRLEVRDPLIVDEADEKAWGINPAGIPQALKVLFPEVIRIQAMQDAAGDVAKQTKGNTLGKLIADVIDPVRRTHEEELREALKVISDTFSADGAKRSEKLKAFDIEATESLSSLFPGLRLKLDVPALEISDLFRNGTVRVIEAQGDACTARTFSSLGHGAQRCIQMALIRYLAEKSADSNGVTRKMLLIDEPELFLHPQGVEQMRHALKGLAAGRYQVVFTTHSPIMLHRDHAPNAVMVRKLGQDKGTHARKPLCKAVKESIKDNGHASRILFEIGNAAQVFFSDRVLLSEGKTEQALIPILYESHFGRTPGVDRTGLIALNGSGSFHTAYAVLKSMEIEVKIVADLDYAFKQAKQMFEAVGVEQPNLEEVKKVLSNLASCHGFSLSNDGMPQRDKAGKGNWSAAKIWGVFAKDRSGAELALEVHEKLKPLGVWIWKEGTIEDVLGVDEKGEDAIQDLEHRLSSLNSAQLSEKYPVVVDFLKWVGSSPSG